MSEYKCTILEDGKEVDYSALLVSVYFNDYVLVKHYDMQFNKYVDSTINEEQKEAILKEFNKGIFDYGILYFITLSIIMESEKC